MIPMTLSDFLKSEELKMTWLDKLNRSYPLVYSTESISRNLKNMRLDKEKIIRPSRFRRASIIVILLPVIFTWVWLLKMLLEFNSSFPILLGAFLFITLMLWFLSRHSFLNRKYIYTISIDSDAISIRNHKFYWTDITETYIMNKYEGRGKGDNSYLLIFKKDGTVGKFDLHMFSFSDIKLSGIIEHYKANAQRHSGSRLKNT
jgi:hypothetical protein